MVEFDEWAEHVPKYIRADRLWSVKAYRLALYISDLSWKDVTRLNKDRRTWGIANQLYRAVSSIGANIAEGYSRASGKDKARFYEYALGSAREARDWYYKSRYILGTSHVNHRMAILTDIMRLLLTMIPQQRGEYEIREGGPIYGETND